MSYTTTTLLQYEFKSIDFSASGATITTTKVTQWLTEADAEIDARLGGRYVVPITGTSALALIGLIEIWLVKHRIATVLEVKTGDDKPAQSTGTGLRKQALDMLDLIAIGKIQLLDATLLDSGDGVRSYNVDNGITGTFTTDSKQW